MYVCIYLVPIELWVLTDVILFCEERVLITLVIAQAYVETHYTEEGGRVGGVYHTF